MTDPTDPLRLHLIHSRQATYRHAISALAAIVAAIVCWRQPAVAWPLATLLSGTLGVAGAIDAGRRRLPPPVVKVE